MNLDKLFIRKKVGFNLFEVDLFKATDSQLKLISDELGLALNVNVAGFCSFSFLALKLAKLLMLNINVSFYC